MTIALATSDAHPLYLYVIFFACMLGALGLIVAALLSRRGSSWPRRMPARDQRMADLRPRLAPAYPTEPAQVAEPARAVEPATAVAPTKRTATKKTTAAKKAPAAKKTTAKKAAPAKKTARSTR